MTQTELEALVVELAQRVAEVEQQVATLRGEPTSLMPVLERQYRAGRERERKEG